jgi:hypothetical protein
MAFLCTSSRKDVNNVTLWRPAGERRKIGMANCGAKGGVSCAAERFGGHLCMLEQGMGHNQGGEILPRLLAVRRVR